MPERKILKKEPDRQEKPTKVELYYKRFVRFVEYYILLCFVIITIFPLLEYSWIPGFIRVVYLTGFPLLIIVVLISLFKEPLLDALNKRSGNTPNEANSSEGH